MLEKFEKNTHTHTHTHTPQGNNNNFFWIQKNVDSKIDASNVFIRDGNDCVLSSKLFIPSLVWHAFQSFLFVFHNLSYVIVEYQK
jgi:hypothetical protein